MCTVDFVFLHVTALEARHFVFPTFCVCARICACVGVGGVVGMCVGGSPGNCYINLMCAFYLFGLFKCDTQKNSLKNLRTLLSF